MQSLQQITTARILKNVFGMEEKKKASRTGPKLRSRSVQPALNRGFTMSEHIADVICVLRFD